MTTSADDLLTSIPTSADGGPEQASGYCAVISEPGPDADILRSSLASVAATAELTTPSAIRETLWHGATPRVIIARGPEAVGALLPWMPLLQASPSTATIALLDSGRAEVIGTLQHFDVWLPGRTPPPIIVQQTVALWALLERQARLTGPRRIRGHNLVVDLGREEALDAEGERIPLTPSEFRLLSSLAVQPGRVVDFGQLGAALPGHFRDAEDAYNSVKVHVGRLRQKLTRATGWDGHLVSVRGRGFLFERRAPRSETAPVPAPPEED